MKFTKEIVGIEEFKALTKLVTSAHWEDLG